MCNSLYSKLWFFLFIEKYPKKGIKILEGIAEITALRLRSLNEDYFNLRKEKNNRG